MSRRILALAEKQQRHARFTPQEWGMLKVRPVRTLALKGWTSRGQSEVPECLDGAMLTLEGRVAES